MIAIMQEFLFQFLFSVGILVIVAMLIGLISRMVYLFLGQSGHNVLVVTGVVGTPIHELGHAIMCLIFGHKIEDICLFQAHDPDGVLGYVNHSYNRKNPYHVIGNFFIALGPIIVGGALMVGLMFLMIPNVAREILTIAQSIALSMDISSGESFIRLGVGLGDIFLSLFAAKNFANGWWWFYIIICLLVATHMKLSRQDVKGGWIGFLVTVTLLFVIDLIVGTISGGALNSMTSGVIIGGSYILSILTIALILALCQAALAFVYFIIRLIAVKISERRYYKA